MRMRKWISFVVMLAFAVSAMPSLSHAAMIHETGVKAELSQSHQNCHHHTDNSTKQKAPSHSDKKACCDKFCKCLGNSCNSPVKIFGVNSAFISLPLATKDQFNLSQQIVTAGLADRIKRPPRL